MSADMFGDTHLNAFGDTHINAFGDTHVNAFGDTHINAFGVWEGQRLTHIKTHLGLDTHFSEVHGIITCRHQGRTFQCSVGHKNEEAI